MSAPLTCTVPEAAELLGVSTWTVRHLIADGQLTARRFGRRVLLSRRAVHALIDPDPSTSASPSPAPASAVPAAGGGHGAVGEPSEPVRLSTGSPSDRGTPDQGLRSTIASLRPDLEQSVRRHPSATKQEGPAATGPSRTPAAG